MKNYLLAVVLVAGAVLVSSCDLFGKGDPADLGGSTDVPFAAVGNEITVGSITSGNTSLPVDASITVTRNDNGEGTVRLDFSTTDLEESPGLQIFAQYIKEVLFPGHTEDANGNVSVNIGFKATEEGMLETVYGEPFVIIRYSDGVGTKYTAETPGGVTQTREIVSKSSTDDFPFGFFNIKVSKVEQNINEGGIRKLTYYANHKFGLVFWQLTLDDGSTVGSYLYSDNT